MWDVCDQLKNIPVTTQVALLYKPWLSSFEDSAVLAPLAPKTLYLVYLSLSRHYRR